LEVIEELIQSIDVKKEEKNPDRVILRNGVFPKAYHENDLIQQKLTNNNIPGQALTFEELTRFNNWFNIHPEKVAGKETITTSREFPISIVGTKEDIIKTIQVNLPCRQAGSTKSKDKPSYAKASDGKESQDNFEFKLELKLKSAKAKLKLLSI
jgi:hypothetical protein